MRTRPATTTDGISPASGGCPFSGNADEPPAVSRRGVLAGAAVLAASSMFAGTGVASAAVPASPSAAPPIAGAADGSPLRGAPNWKHAVGDPRGSDIVAKFGPNREARFGTMFKGLPPFTPDDALLVDLSEHMLENRGPLDDILPDGHDNFDMPSGYIYLGQFIDHDMTHDTTPLPDRQTDPHGLTNFDTPQFDLGSVYGKGPQQSPELYDPNRPGHLLLRRNVLGIEDLPRDSAGNAFTGDPRNDENLIISQMQMAFIKLHNRFMDGEAKGNFARAQQLTRWHFQWVIVHDFLPHVVGRALVDDMVFTLPGGRIRAKTVFYLPLDQRRPMMPIEFSVGAYRWGHSGIRPEYEMHETPGVSPNPAVLPIFDTSNPPNDLRGSRPLPFEATIDWNYFFEIRGVQSPDDRNFARSIDTQVARPLHDLPDSVVAHTPGAILALAQRNLLRGKRLGLPSGQDVAARMRMVLPTMPAPLSNAQLGLTDPRWGGKAPLWFYCLKEAEIGGGNRLGAVAGRIVAEVILGLLQADFASYWNARTPFVPVGGPDFTMGDLLRLAGAPIIDPSTGLPIVS